MNWILRDDIKDDVNKYLKDLNYGNRVDGIRYGHGIIEWAIECSNGELEWFSVSQGCLPAEKYLNKLYSLGAFSESPEKP